MDRSIPQVWDIFATSPGARRRNLVKERDDPKQLKEQEKNPGSDSAVSLGSSDDDEYEERNISKYFDYLNDDDEDKLFNAKKKRPSEVPLPSTGKENVPQEKGTAPATPAGKGNNKEGRSEIEKDIKHIERHLSMKKTIRKKMMRDLQQAFVENPGELQQDPSRISPEKKSHVDLHNLTISKRRMSKSEHSFLDMLKGNESKDKTDRKGQTADDTKVQSHSPQRVPIKRATTDAAPPDDDSGNDSPTREKFRAPRSRPSDPPEIPAAAASKLSKDDKKISFWKRLTGKGKNKR